MTIRWTVIEKVRRSPTLTWIASPRVSDGRQRVQAVGRSAMTVENGGSIVRHDDPAQVVQTLGNDHLMLTCSPIVAGPPRVVAGRSWRRSA
jgi:hypothetical protein